MEQNEYRIYAAIVGEIMWNTPMSMQDNMQEFEKHRNEWYDFAKKVADGVIEKLKENGI